MEIEEGILAGQTTARGYSDEYEIELIRKGGNEFPVSIRIWLVEDKQGKPAGMWALIRDMTEQKRAEVTIQEQYSTLKRIIESSDSPIFSVDTGYRYTSFNRSHAAVMKSLYDVDIEPGKSLLG